MRHAVLALIVLSGCSLRLADDEPPITDDDDEWPNCNGANPGCIPQDCGPWCGDAVYACVDGAWDYQYACDTCLGGVHAYPAFWTLVQTDTSLPGCTGLIGPVVEILVNAPSALDQYASVSSNDPDLVITNASGGQGIGGYPTCAVQVRFDFTDVLPIDGDDVPVTGTWSLDVLDTGGINGFLTAQIGLCTVSASVRGNYEYFAPD